MVEPGPVYAHDCEECEFLAHYDDRDLYYCSKSLAPTVIARRSGEPSDYTSGLMLARATTIKEVRKAGNRDAEALRVAYFFASDLGRRVD